MNSFAGAYFENRQKIYGLRTEHLGYFLPDSGLYFYHRYVEKHDWNSAMLLNLNRINCDIIKASTLQMYLPINIYGYLIPIIIPSRIYYYPLCICIHNIQL